MANTSSDGSGDEKPVDSRLARRRQDAIGVRLRQLYDNVVDETVPDEFLSFLKQAEKRETEGDESGGAQTNAQPAGHANGNGADSSKTGS